MPGDHFPSGGFEVGEVVIGNADDGVLFLDDFVAVHGVFFIGDGVHAESWVLGQEVREPRRCDQPQVCSSTEASAHTGVETDRTLCEFVSVGRAQVE